MGNPIKSLVVGLLAKPAAFLLHHVTCLQLLVALTDVAGLSGLASAARTSVLRRSTCSGHAVSWRVIVSAGGAAGTCGTGRRAGMQADAGFNHW